MSVDQRQNSLWFYFDSNLRAAMPFNAEQKFLSLENLSADENCLDIRSTLEPLGRVFLVHELFVLPSRENTLRLADEFVAPSSRRPDVVLPLRDVSFAENEKSLIDVERRERTYVNRSRIERAFFSSRLVTVFSSVVDERRTRIAVLLSVQRITMGVRSFDR